MIVSTPIVLLRAPGQDVYSRERLKTMLAALALTDYHIEEDSVYRDIIAYTVR